jgi:hypothetical protein
MVQLQTYALLHVSDNEKSVVHIFAVLGEPTHFTVRRSPLKYICDMCSLT